MDMRSLVPFAPRSNPARTDLYPFDALRREFEGLFFDFARSFGNPQNGGGLLLAPRMEVADTDKEIEVSVELPGLERKDIDVSLEGNVLAIRAEKKVEGEQKDRNVHVAERSYGVFYRALELPAKVELLDRRGNHVQGCAAHQDPEARSDRGEEDRGQRSPRGQGSPRGQTSRITWPHSGASRRDLHPCIASTANFFVGVGAPGAPLGESAREDRSRSADPNRIW